MKPLVNFHNIHKAVDNVNKLLVNYDAIVYKQKDIRLSTITKKILKELVSRDIKDKELKKVAYRLDLDFFDEVFENFLLISDTEQLKFIELLSVYKKRIFKNKIYRNLLINYNDANTKKMAYLLTDNYKPSILQIPSSNFIHIIETNQMSYNYYKKSKIQGFFNFVQHIDPTCEAPLSIKILKSLLEQSQQSDYISNENDLLYNFLVNHYNDEDGARFGLHYLSIFNPKSYDQKILSFIIKCKNNIRTKYKELANELDLLLYKVYEYSLVYDRYAEITDDLALTLTDKIISEAFGEDERSIFWKQYINSLVEPIIFVKSPVEMFMMKFNSIGIIEYIDIGNATYLYKDNEYEYIKKRILSSASNEKNILNLNSRLKQNMLKEITKSGSTKYIHRGSWKTQFKTDMQRKYKLLPGQ